jgi:hypothetical protein
MWYLGYVCSKDRGGNAIVRHKNNLIRIVLEKSRSEVEERKLSLRDQTPVYCKKIFMRKTLFFANKNDWGIIDGPQTEQRLRDQGEIKRVFYDTKKDTVLVTGLWNDSVKFLGLDEVQIMGQGLVGEYRKPLMYILTSFSETEQFYKDFQKDKNKIIVGDFGGLLEGAARDHYNAKLMVNILSGHYFSLPENHPLHFNNLRRTRARSQARSRR